jgi:hypothetical protein
VHAAKQRIERIRSQMRRRSCLRKGGFTVVSRISILGTLLSVLILPVHGSAAMGVVVPSSEASRAVVIQNVTAKNGSVSCTVVNNSAKTVRDVELLVRQEWLWNDELHPGADSPGRTLPFTVRRDIAPHASASFILQTPPTAARSDGRFVTTVEVTGFSEVGW